MIQICENNICTGCSACMNICPVGAIDMIDDEFGFKHPIIDNTKCINCKLCQRICPAINNIYMTLPQKVYAAIAKDTQCLNTCASGGVASVVSLYILENDGVVYGCSQKKIDKIEHVRIDNINDLYKIKGSKYVQSNIGTIYKDVKVDLENNKKVLFTGTPCQVAGLLSFLRKKYENLLTIDILCHGVPSQQFLKDDLEICNFKRKSNLVVEFRKKGGELETKNFYGLYLRDGYQGPYIFQKNFLEDPYIISFMSGLSFRESCHTCKFSNIKRVSDITVADFWGLNDKHRKVSKGVSLVLLNTSLGKIIFKAISSKINFTEETLEKAQKGNGALNNPVKRPYNKDVFRDLYRIYGLKYASNKCNKRYVLKYKKTLLINKIKTFIARIPYIYNFYKILLRMKSK